MNLIYTWNQDKYQRNVELKFTGDVNKNWNVFKQSFQSGNCESCGFRHTPKQSPAFGNDKKNHIAKCCLSRKKVQLVEKQSDSDEDEEVSFFVAAIEEVKTVSKDKWIAYLDVNGIYKCHRCRQSGTNTL